MRCSCLALLTYYPGDPSLDTAASAPPRNYLGYSGAVVADLLLQYLGLAAYLLPAGISLGWAFGLLVQHPVRRPLRKLLGLLPLALALGTAAFAVLRADGALVGAGGVIGSLLLGLAGRTGLGPLELPLAMIAAAMLRPLLLSIIGLSAGAVATFSAAAPGRGAGRLAIASGPRFGGARRVCRCERGREAQRTRGIDAIRDGAGRKRDRAIPWAGSVVTPLGVTQAAAAARAADEPASCEPRPRRRGRADEGTGSFSRPSRGEAAGWSGWYCRGRSRQPRPDGVDHEARPGREREPAAGAGIAVARIADQARAGRAEAVDERRWPGTPACWKACSTTSASAARSSRSAPARSSPSTSWSRAAASSRRASSASPTTSPAR